MLAKAGPSGEPIATPSCSTSSSMFLNGYNSKRSALHDLNLADPVS